jgi:hypothetical protein
MNFSIYSPFILAGSIILLICLLLFTAIILGV